jgi:crotonobetainyl-CoA:carnitine CoA-transferase CaiB-like acyl-CoA transferase
LLKDERFATNAARVKNRAFVTETLEPVMRAHPTAWWVEKLEEQSIGGGPINRLHDVFEDPQIKARDVVRTMRHATGKDVPIVANPVRLSATPAEYRIAPPVLGEHTDEILRGELGLDDARLAELRASGTI